VQGQDRRSNFEQWMLPHLDAAHNLARWLTGNAQDAEDMVQEAYLRAFKSFGTFHGNDRNDSRAWLLTIVRNTCYTWLNRNKPNNFAAGFDEELHTVEDEAESSENLLSLEGDLDMLRQALSDLPLELREAIILRELEGLSYKEIARIARVPLGTIMSRLARARRRLQQSLEKRLTEE
jgi:RNA polymerase sigma-70 factor (ECF subfamily)